MAEDIVITAKPRNKTGRGESRRARVDGFIPAVIYGKGIDTTHLLLGEKEIKKTLHRVSGESVLMTLRIEGEKAGPYPVIIKEIQEDPATSRILHIDFKSISLTEKIKIKVPVSAKGESPGVKAGGILEYILREIEVECLPKDIPEKIEINISALEIGDTVHIKDLTFASGVVPVEDKEGSVLSIVPPKAEEVAPAPEAEVTEPEVIKKERKVEEIEEETAPAEKEEAPKQSKEKEK